MKVLLIHPPETNPIKFFGSPFYSLPGKKQHPLSLLYISTYIEKQLGVDVKVLDFPQFISEEKYEKITREVVREFQPQIVGISLYTLSIYDSYNLAKKIKSEAKNIFVVMGGIHTSFYPDEIITRDFIDAIVIGEGEKTFCDLVEKFGTKEMYGIKGLWIKDKRGEIYKNGSSDIIYDLDSLPIPKRKHLYFYSKHSNIFSGGKEAILIASRGCPYSCSYCQLSRRKYRLRSPKNIVDEIEGLVDMGYDFMSFADDSMNVNIEHTKELCREIIRRKLNIQWSFRGVAKTIDEESIRLMSESGCKMIFMGAETGKEETLKKLKRSIMPEDVKRAVSLAKKYKIKTSLYFIIGFPGEKVEDINETINFCISVRPNYAQANILIPTPGSELYFNATKNGFKDWCKEFTKNPQKNFEFPIWETSLTKQELLYLQRKFYRKFYISFGFLKEVIDKIILTLKRREKPNIQSILRIFSFGIKFISWVIFGKNPKV